MTRSSSRQSCDYCGLDFTGSGFTPDGKNRYCCYGCYLVERIIGAQKEEGIAYWILVRLGIGAFLAMNVMMLSMLLYIEPAEELGISNVRLIQWALLLISTPAIIILGLPFLNGSLRRRRFGMDGFIVTTSFIAYAVSALHVIKNSGHIYFDTATMLLLIVTIGRLLEASAKNRTSRAIKDMINLTPSTARVLRNGVEEEIPSDDVVKDDIVVVRPGERIPADGIIVSGECLIEESAFTGESKPRSASTGDRVIGGSINYDGFLHIRATAVGSESMLSRIQALIDEARETKSKTELVAERATVIFAPVVWIIALGSAVYWLFYRHNMEQAVLSSLAVMVVACPCALGIATPIATSLAIGKAAGSGILIRSGEVLENLGNVRKIFFDKTGTLTQGKLALVDIRMFSDSLTQNEVLAWAASLETGSEHAIAGALVKAAYDRGLVTGTARNVVVHPGKGLQGLICLSGIEHDVVVGSEKLINEKGAVIPDVTPVDVDDSFTQVFISIDGTVAAVILLEDNVKSEALDTVEELKLQGIATVLLSGDRQGTADKVSSTLDIDYSIAECTPIEKAEIVRKARQEHPAGVAMVGDGINDAPALAEATVGIAVSGGTDMARHVSDVVLLGDDLRRVPWLLDLSRMTYRVMKRNLLWAFGYNSIAVILAFFGYVHPLIAAAAMVVSSTAVLGNSMRLAAIPAVTNSISNPLEQ